MNNNILEYIYIINENENNAKQPEKINILLKPHQLKMLNKCLQLEQSKIINRENNNIIKTSIGIIGDKVGSGKSYIILGLICNNYNINNNNMQIIHHNPLFKIYSDIYCKLIYKNINILIVPHNIFQQWKLYINNINISVEYIKTQNQLKDIQFNTELILISSTLYNKFADIVNNNKYIFSRVIFDEADSIKIPACKEIKSYFYWFVTSSIKNLLYPTGHYSWTNNLLNNIRGICHNGFIKNTFVNLYQLDIHNNRQNIKYIFLKNDDKLIKKSFTIPDPIIHHIICKNPTILNILNDIISDKIQKMINAGDIVSAIKEIDIQKTNETNLIKLVAMDLYNELDNKKIDLESIMKKNYKDLNKKENDINSINNEINILEDKINNIKNRLNDNNIDPITYEEIQNKIIVNCCKQLFDFESISKYISSTNNPKCPMCRTIISKDNLILIDNNDNNLNINNDSLLNKELDKQDQLDLIFSNKIKNNARIIIFSEFSNTYENIINIMSKHNINFKEMKGNSNVINHIINWYKDDENVKKVLFLNARYYGSGLNLENTSDLIIYHKMDTELEMQIIGRAQRCGRINILNIWKLLYENE
jgi:hypothetical protein